MDKRPVGRPEHVPTEATRMIASALKSCGIPNAQIAKEIGIALTTLTTHYQPELEDGGSSANAKIIGTLFQDAIGAEPELDEEGKVIKKGRRPNPISLYFWAKTRMKWRETTHVVHEIADKNLLAAMSLGVSRYFVENGMSLEDFERCWTYVEKELEAFDSTTLEPTPSG